MDGFAFVILGGGLVVFMCLVALGVWAPGSGAEQLDWKPTRSPEVEVQNELDDIDQMIEAQNERRRRTGRAEISEDEVRARVDADERAQNERAARYREQHPDAEEPS